MCPLSFRATRAKLTATYRIPRAITVIIIETSAAEVRNFGADNNSRELCRARKTLRKAVSTAARNN